MKTKKILITGGAGFLGSHLVKYISSKKESKIVVFDKLENHKSEDFGRDVIYIKGNIISAKDVRNVFLKQGPFDIVYHLASSMPNKEVSNEVLWKTNTTGTLNLVSEAVKNKVKSFVFTSSNVVYGIPKELPVTEETTVGPLEIYGRSKVQAERELEKYKNNINIQIIRCPVMTGLGRLGLQAILYEFVDENKNVYVLGDGSNKYQFADATDVCIALDKASHIKGFEIYNIGADEVMSLKQLYQKVIEFAHSKSNIISVPKTPSLACLWFLDKLNISPLGVYQYTMIGRSLYADTSKIKKKLNWKPKKTNLDTFIENYRWYKENKGNFTKIGSGNFSANRSLPKMGVLSLLKLLS